MATFKKNDKVVKIITGGGYETASIQTVLLSKKGKVSCDDDGHIWYDANSGFEIDPVIPGFSSRLIVLES